MDQRSETLLPREKKVGRRFALKAGAGGLATLFLAACRRGQTITPEQTATVAPLPFPPATPIDRSDDFSDPMIEYRVNLFNWIGEVSNTFDIKKYDQAADTLSPTDRQKLMQSWNQPIKLQLGSNFTILPSEEADNLLQRQVLSFTEEALIPNLRNSNFIPFSETSLLWDSFGVSSRFGAKVKLEAVSFFKTETNLNAKLALEQVKVERGLDGQPTFKLLINTDFYDPRVQGPDLPVYTMANLAAVTRHELEHIHYAQQIFQTYQLQTASNLLPPELIKYVLSNPNSEPFAYAAEEEVFRAWINLGKTPEEQTKQRTSLLSLPKDLLPAWERLGRDWKSKEWLATVLRELNKPGPQVDVPYGGYISQAAIEKTLTQLQTI